jgi:uncharacterized protein (TIGR00290 family)
VGAPGSTGGKRGVKPRVLLSWSSGKDSAWALHVLRGAGEVEVVGLLTTLNEAFDRVAMHAVRREVLEAQARAAGLPLVQVPIPWPCSNEQYEAAMAAALDRARAEWRITHAAFGDLFLEEIRAYREEKLRPTGLTPLFPLWRRPTGLLARQMVDGGLRAVITCVDPRRLSPSYAGRSFDTALLEKLPAGVDPCGENGEFHTLAVAGPMFSAALAVEVGEVVERDGFVFADVVFRDLTPGPSPQRRGELSAESLAGDPAPVAGSRTPPSPLRRGAGGEVPIFDADGALSREFLLARGYCCENGCRNCPYGFRREDVGMAQ